MNFKIERITNGFKKEKQSDKQNKPLYKIKLCWQNITVEPAFLLFVIPFSMSSLVVQNLNLEKACRVNLNLSNSICDAIQNNNYSGYNQSDEILVQKIVSTSYIWKNVINGVFPTILLPMLGSWSDRNNIRKALMLIPIMGEALSKIGFLLCTYFFYELIMEVNIIVQSLSVALTGGLHSFYLGVYTYLAVVSTQENRTLRLGIGYMIYGIGYTMGFALSGIMYNAVGFYGVFSICLIMYILAGIYIIFIVNKIENKNEKMQTKLELTKDLVNIKQTFNTFTSVFKPRQTNLRTQIVMVMVSTVLVIGPFTGEAGILYMYTRLKFNWDETQYSMFFAYYYIIHAVGIIIALAVFTKCLKLDDALLAIISILSKMVGGVGYMLAKTPTLFYVGTLLEILSGPALISTRSIITKLVLPNELGTVNALFGIAESLTILIYGSMYSAIYKAFLATFPGAFFLAGITFTIPAILIYLWLYKQRHSRELSSKSEDFLQEQIDNQVVEPQNCKIDLEKEK